MTVEIRRITQVSDALEEAFARLMPQLSPRLGAPSREALRRVAGSETGALLAAVAGERIVGVLTLAWYDAPSGRKAWIEDVVVDGAARGCGAGDALVRAAVEHAARIGAGKVMLTSNPAREAARALYRKVGFEEVETTVFAFKTDK
ncbi:GNAT family N-acetyltransferase [Alistipes finegoldii]|jgi:ribosomal protein S18 acetylase RimI-like enzyme|uniref:GNAT family N-acetyltransferase n=1 Tax=Alistipes finegoldii TaxID=214856 RepID=UPI00307D109A